MKWRASSSVYGTGMIGIRRWISVSRHAAAMAVASSARYGRRVMTPSLSGGLGGLNLSGMEKVCRGVPQDGSPSDGEPSKRGLRPRRRRGPAYLRWVEHTSELQSRQHL